jgi:hypothetical protein
MAALINHSNYTFTADEIRAYNEILLKAVTEIPQLTDFHSFEQGIKNDKQIGLADGSFGLIGKAAQTCGTLTPDTKLLATQQKKWEPKRLQVLLRECWADLDATMGRLSRQTGNNVSDLTSTDYMTFILSILEKDLGRMIFRKAWFDDQNAATTTDSPAGVLTAGTDKTYFNLINGFFQQLGVIIAADATRKTTIAANTEATFALQDSAFTNALAYSSLLAVIDGAKPALRAASDQVILCTGSVGRKAMRHLQDKGLAFTLDTALNGLQMIQVDGRTIYVIEWWDELIRAYQSNGTKYNSPHRIVYTTKSNLVVGMEANGLFENFDVYHDKVNKYTYIEAIDAMDAKILDDTMVQYGV